MTRTAALGGFLLAALAGAALLPAAASAEASLRPFTAHYQVKFHGLSGGTLELTLKKGDEPGQYLYTSSAKPSFLAAFVVSSDANETSTLALTPSGILPNKFASDDGKKGNAKDSVLNFDWSAHRLNGTAEGQPLDMELPERTQDHLSIQIAVMWDLVQNREPGVYPMIDGAKLKEYEYKRDGKATIKYDGRDIEAIMVRSARTGGSDRITRYWHVPELEYMPVRAERTTKGEVDLVMQMVDFKFAD